MHRLLFACIGLLFALPVFALEWKGCLRDAESGIPLLGATITNTRSLLAVQTDREGNFSIEGLEGDKVTFSCPGYATETHIILKGLEDVRLTFRMKMSGRQLREVVVKQKYKTVYQRDSADRASTYSRTMAQGKAGLASPVSFLADRLSPSRRALFRFQKDYKRNEEGRFVDSRYSPELTATLTGLSGDTLAYFINSYPMPYDYARNATALELKAWIRANYRDFLQKTDSLRQLKLPIVPE